MFSIDTRGMACVHSFSEAKQFFESLVQPTRGDWKENERPLQNVRKHHMRLRKINDDTYACTLHSTDMVVYRRRGPITVCLHDSISSRKFLDRTLPLGVLCDSHRGNTVLRVPTVDDTLYLTGNRVVIEKEEGKYNGNNSVAYRLVSGADQRVRERLNKDLAKELRAKFKPFLTWWKAANNVVPFPLTYNKYDFEHCLPRVIDRDTWGVLAQHVGTPTDFMARVYDLMGARELHPIPNTEPFKVGRHWKSS